MKKIILLIILLIPIISAVEVDMETEFSSGETLTATVSGNFLESISKENVFFYRGHVRVPMGFDIAKIDDEFHIYALLPQIETTTNYSIIIKDIQYMEGNKISEDEIQKNFSISEQMADFNVNPGFIIAENDFFIKVQNLLNNEIEIKINLEGDSEQGFFSSLFGLTTNDERTITLKSGEIKKINFEIEDIIQSVLGIIELKTDDLKYEVPIYLSTNIINEEEEKEEEKEENENEEKQEEEEYAVVTIKTCLELNGEICKSNEKCEGKSKLASDGKCCLGNCEEFQKSSTGKIIGWFIIIAICIFAYWFFAKKYKKVK